MRHIAMISAAALMAACATDPVPSANMAQQSAMAPVTDAAHREADADALQGLTRILIDAQELYRDAAVEAENETYTAELERLAAARAGMTETFQTRIIQMGEPAPQEGQPLGSAHRAFMEARTLGDEDTKAAVEEALRGENYLADQMREEQQNADLSVATRSFIAAQLASVEADRARLQAYASTLQ